MFGNKLRSWMEAVRPKRKQQRKEKQSKSTPTNDTIKNPSGKERDGNVDRRSVETLANTCVQNSRYSGTNLSSPESAYSTGYSTDGTSPGAPPEYYINIKTGTRCPPPPLQQVPEKRSGLSGKHASRGSPCLRESSPRFLTSSRAKTSSYADLSSSTGKENKERLPTVAIRYDGDRTTVSMDYDASANGSTSRTSVTLQRTINAAVTPRLTEVVVNSSITSPRQRNRIRTNPWVPGSPANGLQKANLTNGSSPVSLRYLSPNVPCSPINRSNRRNSLSSSSCSSLSASSVHYDPTVVRKIPRNNSGSDDDCTLNEMMGKYDESYVYEKETDILSDSDPTDCETDMDTGQDGGDEEDPLECEFDFIDNGSYLEFNIDGKEERNSGHCTYYNFEIQRTSRRRTTRRSQKHEIPPHDRKKKSNSSKKKPKAEHSQQKVKAQLVKNNFPVDGSRSAGATPLSVRRSNLPVSKLVMEEGLRKRSNSVGFSRNPTSTFDRRDKEADKKYKELIVEAEHILMSMKTNGLSPRRLPVPPNKRVELLRNTECPKPDAVSRIPSSNFNSPRFSPKKNHITNFISTNSPVMPKREQSPLVREKRSPKYKKKSLRENGNTSSSDSDDAKNSVLEFGCPQSEPVRRKVYGKKNKNVAFNLNYETVCNERGVPVTDRASAENLRQQVLLNTIANLKRSLEDQSASLKQVYKGSKIIDD